MDLPGMQPSIGGFLMLKYTCYSDMCARVENCPHCDQEMEVYGMDYDLDDFGYDLQERFVLYGECCMCGSTAVEQ